MHGSRTATPTRRTCVADRLRAKAIIVGGNLKMITEPACKYDLTATFTSMTCVRQQEVDERCDNDFRGMCVTVGWSRVPCIIFIQVLRFFIERRSWSRVPLLKRSDRHC